jgi:outer membrane lipoprotein LolB
LKLLFRLVCSAVFIAIFSIAGCASYTGSNEKFSSYSSPWHGRLSLRINPEQGQSQSFSAEFELTGNEQAGELTLYSPLGSTAAAMTWTPQSATMRANGEIRHFESLGELLREVVGTELPVGALFAWVSGERKGTNGWSADLTDYPRGRIKARRQDPTPAAELNLVLTR